MAQHKAQQTLRLIDVIDSPQTTNTILIGMLKKRYGHIGHAMSHRYRSPYLKNSYQT